MDTCPTIRVKPWGKDQGDFVVINTDDFNPAAHTRFDAPADPAPKPRRKKVTD